MKLRWEKNKKDDLWTATNFGMWYAIHRFTHTKNKYMLYQNGKQISIGNFKTLKSAKQVAQIIYDNSL